MDCCLAAAGGPRHGHSSSPGGGRGALLLVAWTLLSRRGHCWKSQTLGGHNSSQGSSGVWYTSLKLHFFHSNIYMCAWNVRCLGLRFWTDTILIFKGSAKRLCPRGEESQSSVSTGVPAGRQGGMPAPLDFSYRSTNRSGSCRTFLDINISQSPSAPAF